MPAEGPDRSLALEPGQVVAGKYLIEKMLGRGGMGVVFQAQHLLLEERVALKIVAASEGRRRASSVRRLLREARAASRLCSGRTARVRDVDRLADGTPYVVMDLLIGDDLAAYLAREGPLPVDLAVHFLLDACEALAEAHARGIVHRDIKPSNLFVESPPGGRPRLKVLDFGIAKTIEPDDVALTASDSVLGSPRYASPEQIRSSRDIGPASDVWSLGVVLYELVSGDTPFRAQTASALLAAVVADAPTPLRAGAPHIPAALEEAVLRCLEKAPQRRWESVVDLATALAPLIPDGATRLEDIAASRSDPAPGSGARALHERDGETVDPLDREESDDPPSALVLNGGDDRRDRPRISTGSNWFTRSPAPERARVRGSRVLLGAALVSASALLALVFVARAFATSPTSPRSPEPSPEDTASERPGARESLEAMPGAARAEGLAERAITSPEPSGSTPPPGDEPSPTPAAPLATSTSPAVRPRPRIGQAPEPALAPPTEPLNAAGAASSVTATIAREAGARTVDRTIETRR